VQAQYLFLACPKRVHKEKIKKKNQKMANLDLSERNTAVKMAQSRILLLTVASWKRGQEQLPLDVNM